HREWAVPCPHRSGGGSAGSGSGREATGPAPRSPRGGSNADSKRSSCRWSTWRSPCLLTHVKFRGTEWGKNRCSGLKRELRMENPCKDTAIGRKNDCRRSFGG